MSKEAVRRFDEAPRDAAIATLLDCVDIRRWADEVADARPFADLDAALEAARTAADPWTATEIEAALAHHPRIGEKARGSDADVAASQREQAGVDPTDASLTERLRSGNQKYEERFDRVFLIRAAGRDATEILAQLDDRLTNDDETERRVTAQQLREIAVLRLEGVLS